MGTRDLERFVSAQQLTGVFQRSAASARRYLASETAARREPRPQDTIPLTVKALLRDPVLTERMSLSEPLRFTRPMVVLLVFFALLAVAAGLVVVWMERRQALAKRVAERRAQFPTAHVPLRLGLRIREDAGRRRRVTDGRRARTLAKNLRREGIFSASLRNEGW